ncbi:MAG TPA: intradiol ring-cleavage dioxygenase [Vicinamibacterales bacterium]|nr:intradiol ring-cleavage dioxygenase [Vicinamibacterales bacterium]
MLDDDGMVGRLLSRREVVKWLGAAGTAAVIGDAPAVGGRRNSLLAQVPACVVVPQQMEGPYFVDEKLNRSDIRTDPADGKASAGAELALALKVASLAADGKCTPLPSVLVDIWQCDAVGIYSDVQDSRVGFDTKGRKFLRGYQTADANGMVRFTTIYPGWYPGRAVHVHFKIRTNAGGARGEEFTSQLYFDEAITDAVHALPPYRDKSGRRTLNAADGIYKNGGRELMLELSKTASGYAGTFELALRRG